MAQRSGTDTTKTGRRKPVVIDRPETPTASPRRRKTANDPNRIIEGLRRHLDEALEQQAATSEVLRIISRSPGDLQPVFDIIAASGELIELAAVHNLDDFKGGIDRFAAFAAPQCAFDRSARKLLESRVSTEGFPSGQREQTVNLPALPSKVRILPPPPGNRQQVTGTGGRLKARANAS